ncbi:MAG: DUF5605 domain-containing protein [Microbacterium sp.]
MSTFHARSSIADVLAQVDARAAIERIAPEVLESPLATDGISFPLARVLPVILDEGDPRVEELLEALGVIEDRTPPAAESVPIAPRPDYEGDDVARGSASIVVPSDAALRRRVEILLTGPSHGNPFVDVELHAVFSLGDEHVRVGGFYDGDGRYVVRFLPPAAGVWTVEVSSTARSLDGVTATLEVAASNERGPVSVSNQFDFAYADGTRYTPLGTTAYVWTLQDEQLQEQTLESLADAPFTKLRMGLFPKHFVYNANEPERFPFPKDGEGWDTSRFDLDYFRHLERRIDQLAELGIEADLILFHPYDRWGFAAMGAAADDRYVGYIVRRLSAFVNVWWSLANEYDLLLSKGVADWDRIAAIVRANDPVGHPLSIHNWIDLWDYSSEWATHCSIQSGSSLHGSVRDWRRRWSKPVIVDELGYEGDLEHGWGFLTAEEEVRRVWEVVLAGGYATHGETFWEPGDVVFWAKGGRLRGESPARLAFLREIVAASPTGALAPLRSDFDTMVGGVEGEYVITYFGAGQPRIRTVTVPAGRSARIDVIDTWNMTVDEVPGVHTGAVAVELPVRPYVAIRITVVD